MMRWSDRRFILFSLSSIYIRVCTSDVPPVPIPYQEVLPDGSFSQPIKLVGNTRENHEEDQNGFTVIHDDDGWLVYAKRDNQTGDLINAGIRVGEGNPSAIARPHETQSEESLRRQCGSDCEADLDDAPHDRHLEATKNRRKLIRNTGTVKNLVVLLRFADHVNRTQPTKEYIDIMFNGYDGYHRAAPTGSVRDVFLQSSYGQLTIESTVYPWITLNHTEAYYAAERNGKNWLLKGALHEALNIIDADPDFDISQFNSDYDEGDTYIDAISFLHSGYGAEFSGTDCYGTGRGGRIWSHKTQLYPGRFPGLWTSKDDKVTVEAFHIEPAVYGLCASNVAHIGTSAHEVGHFFGITDLYDGSGGSGIGNYGLMANSWGFTGSQQYPPIMCPWSKIQLGWLTPTILSEPGDYDLGPSWNIPKVYKITHGYPEGEYLLIENRQPKGFDKRMPQGGLCIWHIDDNTGYKTEGYPGQEGWPANGNHYRVALVQADGNFNLERGQNRGDGWDVWQAKTPRELNPSNDPLQGPFPNSDAYQNGNVYQTWNRIYNISYSRTSMTFSYSNTMPSTSTPTESPSTLPTSSPVWSESESPTSGPTQIPTQTPTTNIPTLIPTTNAPSENPTHEDCTLEEGEFILDLSFDFFPEETFWKIKDEDGSVIFRSKEPYENKESTLLERGCLAVDDCYTFIIYDRYKDGMCCAYGNGNFTFSFAGNELLSGGDFGAKNTIEFGSCNRRMNELMMEEE